MMHIFHKYSPWRDIEQAIVVHSDDIAAAKDTGLEPAERIKIIQERRCIRCGRLELRTVIS